MVVWEQEACGRLCERQSKKLQNTIETISGLIDVKDMQLSQITRDFLNLTKMLAEVDQKQYPETLGRMFIINVPSVFPFVWRMVKVWKLELYCSILHLSLDWKTHTALDRSCHCSEDQHLRGPEGV
jgi:hypothetical protein